MEKVSLWFQPGDRREGFRWQSSYQNIAVGLCNRPFCQVCNLPEREKLRGFSGGRIEVQLTLHRRPSFWEERQFYLGHLVRSLPKVKAVDEGIEYDVSKFNAFLYLTSKGGILVDPGVMGFDEEKNPLLQLIANRRVVATIITHGHQDHWNNLSVLRANSPIFLPSLAFQLASRHASLGRDFHLLRLLDRAKRVVPGEPILFEQNLPLQIDTISLPHSIPETVGLIIRGEKRRVVHLADFKFNGMEARTKAATIAQFSEIAREKVDLLVVNIINAHIPGFTPLEALVIETLTDIIARAKKRVIITCFSTNLERIRRISEVAQLLDRPVQFFGAGMQNSKELLRIENGEGDLDQAVVFVTGCQAEEESILWRIAQGENPLFELRPDDILVASARCVPGKEESLCQQYLALRPKVERVIVNEGEVEQLGLGDLDFEEALIHVSGHESREGLRLALEILQPKSVLPWPQTSPQFEAFREIAEPLGVEILDEKERVVKV